MTDEEIIRNTQKPVQDIFHKNGKTIIVFEDNTSMTVNSEDPTQLNDLKIPRCVCCGHPADNYPLFSFDNVTFLCRHCVGIAMQTFKENHIPLGGLK